MQHVHPTARKTSARDAHARKLPFVRAVRGDAHTRRHHSSQSDQVCLQNASPHIFSKRHAHISVHARHTNSPARRTLCTSAQRCKDKAKTTSTHHSAEKHTHTHSRTHEDTRANPQPENITQKPFSCGLHSELSRPSVIDRDKKRMIEHQSPTVTERDSLLRQKPRRLRRSQHLNGTAKKLRTTSGRNV